MKFLCRFFGHKMRMTRLKPFEHGFEMDSVCDRCKQEFSRTVYKAIIDLSTIKRG